MGGEMWLLGIVRLWLWLVWVDVVLWRSRSRTDLSDLFLGFVKQGSGK
jgi:hypothetical protein